MLISFAGKGTYKLRIKRTVGNSEEIPADVPLKIYAVNKPQEVVFEKKQVDSEGNKHFYIFDDNHERIRNQDLADGDTPTTIAHFEDLEPGIYTFFGYHNRDHSAGGLVYYDPVLKGKVETANTVVAQDIEYYIDDNTRGFLPVIINNDLYKNTKQKIFSTYSCQFDDNSCATTVKSIVVPLKYNGIGVTRGTADDNIEENGYVGQRIWNFDSTQNVFVQNIDIPENMQQNFGGKEKFNANESILPWVSDIMNKPESNRVPIFQYLGGNGEGEVGIISAPTPYEITYEYNITIHNMGEISRDFSYIQEGNAMYIKYEIIGNRICSFNGHLKGKEHAQKNVGLKWIQGNYKL